MEGEAMLKYGLMLGLCMALMATGVNAAQRSAFAPPEGWQGRAIGPRDACILTPHWRAHEQANQGIKNLTAIQASEVMNTFMSNLVHTRLEELRQAHEQKVVASGKPDTCPPDVTLPDDALPAHVLDEHFRELRLRKGE
jgi:hypothetical protein